MFILDLLEQPESDFLDFKREWHNDTVNLVLDILCMANSDAKSDRYIVIGYDEKEKTICDVSANRRKLDDIYDILCNSNFNRLPNIYVETFSIDDKELDVLIIKKTNYRPYFLTKDKVNRAGNRTIRAGVIYTRNGSINTPIDQSATESQVADMWRERFGLTLSPKDRLEQYINDVRNWEYNYNEENRKYIYYYIPFPEFTMEYTFPENVQDYSKDNHSSYIFANSIGNSYTTTLRYKYHTTILKQEDLFLCDKSNYRILHPHADWLYYNPDDYKDLHIFAHSSEYSDRGKRVEEIDYKHSPNGNYHQVVFCYNIKNSFEYCVQEILNNKNYRNIYRDYIYFDSSSEDENKNIKIPHQIYLFDQDEDIAQRIRQEFLNLQD